MKRMFLLSLVALIGCDSGQISGLATPPEREPGDPTELAPGRRIRRLTADQFHRSLEIATGQSWSRYERFAGTLGKADYAEVTDEGTALSVTFDKLVHDAVRETCKSAMDAVPAEGGEHAILRFATISDRGENELSANLQYLHLRFLGMKIERAEDPRLTPWLKLLQAAPPAKVPGEDVQPLSDDAMARRWEAVCIGLATHPDFLTY